MNFFTKAALALGIAVAPVAAASAQAEQFRAPAPQSFSAEELQSYGLSENEISTVQSYEKAGYRIELLTPEEAEAYNAGLTNNNILAIIGLVAIVVVVAAAI